MKKRYEFLISEKQEKEIQKRSEEMGFIKKSDYIRYMALMEPIFKEKLDEILKCLKKLENEIEAKA